LLHTFTMSAINGMDWSVSRPCLCSLGKDDNVPTEWGATGAVRMFWARIKCVVITRIETQTFQNVEEVLYNRS
jgi:hypothetical protein